MTYLANNENHKLDIITFPNPILSRVSENIDILGPNRPEYMRFIMDMMDLYRSGGEWGHMVGLAAPQVGKNWNIFIALGSVFINPVLTIDLLKGCSDLQEGCYSLVKGKYDYPVKRAYKVKLEWLDVNGEKQKKNFFGREAQVVQHEYDHLQGKCCLDGGTKEFD